jgi:xylan 1,4-beta-xylosidase
MKTKIFLLSLLLSLFSIAENNVAVFSYFNYTGNDSYYAQKADMKTGYFNPILTGFYPDPSICRKGKDYFMVNSTFCYYPGIPIFTSRDLVNWKQIGHVLNRPSQLKTEGLDLSEGIFAPAIEYNPYNDTFYLVTTLVTKGNSGMSFVVKTKNLKAGWSDPIWLPEVGGIDPSISFIDGKAYIVNNENPQGGQIYKGHKAIWIQEYNMDTDKMTGPRLQLINGGNDISKKPIWIEGPHLYKIGSYYYLMAAEGGTGFNHSEVIFRSTSLLGPYNPCPFNPILTQRNLPENSEKSVTCAGHADLIQTPKGKWYAVFLASRPYFDKFFNTGRETFLLPVNWKDSFPVILEKGKLVSLSMPNEPNRKRNNKMSGNFTWIDHFRKSSLAPEWNMIRTPHEKWWSISNHSIGIQAMPCQLNDKVNPAFMGRRQQHQNFSAHTMMRFNPRNEKEFAGLTLIQNELNYLIFGKTVNKNKIILIAVNCIEGISQQVSSIELSPDLSEKHLTLHIEVHGGECRFLYQVALGQKKSVTDWIDITHLSTRKAGGFVGSYIGMYASSAFSLKTE